MSFFVTAAVEHDGRTLALAPEQLEPLVTSANYWHGAGNPSSWLAVTVFLAVRARFPGVPDQPLLDLAARAMAIGEKELRSSIEFHENYMRWHDGDPEYRIL